MVQDDFEDEAEDNLIVQICCERVQPRGQHSLKS
jgi:hypothetical protein